ncbi:MAG TPA: flagellar FlbD family protein [Acidimicrobiales bacterium]|nr:flagellar FlbD family protein [Acidimicrobiales bacterium]
MIVVTKLDGKRMALSTDRIERVEHNDTSDSTNIHLIGGSTLIVADPVDEVVERIGEAKARTIARAFLLADEMARERDHPARASALRVLHDGEEVP